MCDGNGSAPIGGVIYGNVKNNEISAADELLQDLCRKMTKNMI